MLLSQFKCNFIVFILCFIFLWGIFSGKAFLEGVPVGAYFRISYTIGRITKEKDL